MVVIVLEKVPPRLHGYLSRWLIEIQSGIYVGNVSASIRDLLWEKAAAMAGSGRLVLAWRTNSIQGFDFKFLGTETREAVDLDGIKLVSRIQSSPTLTAKD